MVMAGLVPAIHALLAQALQKMWMPGTGFTHRPAEGRTRVPGMRRSARLIPAFTLVTSGPLTVPRSRPAPSPQPKSDLFDFGRSINHRTRINPRSVGERESAEPAGVPA